MSYRQLEQRANALARRLRALGVGPEVLVGLCLPRSLELLIALLAILKAGGAYVPLDTGYPAQRLSYLLADSQAAVLLTRRGVGEELAAQSSGRVLWWEEYEAAALEEEEEEENRRPEEVGHREPELCDLHLRLDWKTQRGSDQPRERGASGGVGTTAL